MSIGPRHRRADWTGIVPPCVNKNVRVTDGADGFVGPHGGILGVGDLDPRVAGWLHPVLEVSVDR